MVLILKPFDDAEKILKEIEEFLANRGLKVKESKTKLVKSTDGFDFLGWHFNPHSALQNVVLKNYKVCLQGKRI